MSSGRNCVTAEVLAHSRTDADDARRMVGQVGRELVDIAQDALRMALQRLPGGGQRDAARMALEQLGADRRLEVGQPPAGRADRERRELGALADAAAARDEAEQRQREQVEAVQVHGRGGGGRRRPR